MVRFRRALQSNLLPRMGAVVPAPEGCETPSAPERGEAPVEAVAAPPAAMSSIPTHNDPLPSYSS
ncbi:hypothetical protein NITHO_3000010 [Nitrolancea hollandica Lb]|uniref:Uncharacterized protein n=1 Tax=Nitrolancea hollandica Lb TaxID=1129897 RepID=I4EH54_9BACT|nr:hypothetical protein NITHO_3000010 [Nitrolancea hollandica Lb]